MSTWGAIDVTCPACGVGQKVRVAYSLNIARAPEWRDVILRDELHRFPCRACGKPFRVDVAFDYVDFDRKQLFAVFAERDEPRWRAFEDAPRQLLERNITGASLPPFVRALGEGFCLRTMFGTRALREKLLVFDAGLDDVSVEMLKLAWMHDRGLSGWLLQMRPRVDAIREGEVVLVAKTRDGKLESFGAPLDSLRGTAAGGDTARELRASTYVDVGRWTTPPA